MHGDLVVLLSYGLTTGFRLNMQWLASWTANQEVLGSNPGQGRNLVEISASPVPLANSDMMSTLTILVNGRM